MKNLTLLSILLAGFCAHVSAQHLRFWTEQKDEGNKYVVSVFAGITQDGAAAEELKGVNLRYYYESADMEFENFMLSDALIRKGFYSFGGQGNNGFREGDASRYGNADRFVGHAPFVGKDGITISAGDKVKVSTITFRKRPGVKGSDIDAYLIGAKIFRAMTYTALPACPDGCPVIVIPAPATPQGEPIVLDVAKYGPDNSHLTWAVNNPDAYTGYVIERQIEDAPWERLAELKSEGQFVHVYVDEKAFDGTRQKQIISYRVRALAPVESMSDIEQLDFHAQKMIIEVFPNPASDKVQVTMTPTETDGEAALEIYSTDGKLAFRNALLPGSVKEVIDLASSGLSSGSYTIHLVSGGKILDARPLHVMR